MKNCIYVFLLIASSILFSCASADTTITGFKNPDYTGSTMKKILIYAMLSDLELRQSVEKNICSYAAEVGYNFKSSLKLISPIKQYSSDEIVTLLKENEFDGICIINILDVNSNTSYIPESKYSTTSGKGYTFGNYFKYSSSTSTYSTGGDYVSKPVIKVETALFNINDEIMAWYSQSTTSGNGYAGTKTLCESYAEEMLYKLYKNKVIK